MGLKDSKEGNKEILLVVDAVSNEKGVSKEVIFGALEVALASAAKKRYEGDPDVRVTINRRTGNYETFRRWLVVADAAQVENPARQLLLDEARGIQADAQLGSYVEIPLENAGFGGRIAAQTAKQVIVQRVRDAERAQIVDAYLHRKGELIGGVVKRLDRGDVIIDVGGNVEAKIARDDLNPRESFRIGERVRGYLKDVRLESRGPQLFISRVAPEFLIALFTLEVPEINQGIIEIKGATRDPGSRAKIAVKSKDTRIDPVGACVGMRGARVQSVTNELAGERIDIVQWDDDPIRFVMNAMSPAEVESIVVDEDTHSMDIIVAEEKQLAQAIGKGGQNVQLASRLTGWTLNVMTKTQAQAQRGQEDEDLRQMFVEQLGIDEEIAEILVREGFAGLEEVAYVPVHEMLEIREFDQEIIDALRERARDVLLTRAIAAEERFNDPYPAEDLMQMEGMDEQLAVLLASRGILTMEDLAELSVDDLNDIAGLDDERAAKLIMTARAPWFSNEH
ncbi:transcription pausing; L factor [Candidatus Competibacter denitrificans Run_A_D11]|uniref:Transcription termination/antitermination protein NusA n=1 Tax=Candidatus Competibacter denitrificans Run_A_D11 TaxID=1400863 RepID=W6MDK6_9GAMM|nr:transcription termination factor NusA [Candidatus Competibacter denitrificans]CDI03028.1 transcription pausing; L factor [Candidatus Competibacter denitrificans Run_A_D11]HAS85274.1 transcription termination/antitermination protein NusA [Candidatus Competibacteraceae bacterium]HRC69304.1 transcription termination factor NusA [Candidatus Competibacter denitrificans]